MRLTNRPLMAEVKLLVLPCARRRPIQGADRGLMDACHPDNADKLTRPCMRNGGLDHDPPSFLRYNPEN